MLRIALCDDEALAREQLSCRIEELIEDTDSRLVYEFSSGTNAVRWLKNHPGEIDLLFLDVEMKDLNGMETAKAIREFDRNILLVFVTGYPDYVFEGYQAEALDYLIKPADSRRLLQVLSRAGERLKRDASSQFLLQNTDGIFRFRFQDIAYFYSDRRRVFLVSGEREYGFYGKLDQVEAQVGDSFVRIHQRYLVNPDYIKRLGAACVELSGISLPISRSLKASASGKIARHLLKGDRP